MGSLFWFSCSRSLCTTEACRYRTHSNPRNHLKRCPTERYNTKNPIKSFLIFKKHTFTLKGIARYKSMTNCNINSTSIKTLYKSIAKCRVLLKFDQNWGCSSPLDIICFLYAQNASFIAHKILLANNYAWSFIKFLQC